MTERNSVCFGTTTIEYEVHRSERRHKTVQITVDGSGVHVAAPVETSEEKLRAIVLKRAPWIVREASTKALEASPKRFVSGETLPYLGRNVGIIVQQGKVRSPHVRFDHWRFQITVPARLRSEERYDAIRKPIIQWYRTRAAARLPEVVDRWRPQLGLTGTCRVLVRDQKTRWASCAPDGTLRFNWRTMMVKPALIEYVVVHELAHLIHPNHSQDFWNALTKAMPDAPDRRKALKEAGRELPL
ncbi:MAG: SprT family zinc-dependent metalloprotease [Chloroflexota bacterium]|nr:SprT family zinc-dependent metalloprotease [Chloroflexota bacterium]